MHSLFGLLSEHPKCRVLIEPGSPRHKAQSGDVKFIRGKMYLRQQAMSEGCYLVRNGRPVFVGIKEVVITNSQNKDFQIIKL